MSKQTNSVQSSEENKTSDEDLATIKIETRSTYHQISRIMLLNAKQTVDIYAFKLEPEIVSHSSVINALKLLPRQYTAAKIRILVQESRETVTECAAFVEMARKYSSLVDIRRMADLKETHPASWMTVDHEKYISRSNYHSYHGKACHKNKLEVRSLTELFDEQWEQSCEDPELRQIFI